jgi:VanZ family protein
MTRRTYFTAAVLFGLFAIYGSLVPLDFHPLPLGEALARFSRISYLTLGIGSRADFVSNILLFIPLGFLLSGACLVDRRGWVRAALAATGIGLFGFALSVAIEFTQVYFPPRTVSLNDILAETSGALLGVALWSLVGPALTEWLRAFSGERRRPLLLVRLLAAYAVLFLISQLMPFDITIDLGELAQKYRAGRIVLVPFGHAYPSMLAGLWDLGTDALLWMPVGALASIGWLPSRTRRRPPVAAFAMGVFMVGLVELAQLFIFTRYADVTDLLTGALGIAGGIFIVTASVTSGTPAARPSGIRMRPIGALLVWLPLLAVYHWAPFDFAISREALREGLRTLWVVPFRNYYFGSEFHAFTELTRKFLLAAPVGALLRLAVPPSASRAVNRLQHASFVLIALMVFGALEAGQIFLPGRIADLTDVMIAVAGAEAGRWLVERLRESRPRAYALDAAAGLREP